MTLRLEWLSPDELADNPQNPRQHPEEQSSLLTDLIKKVGWAGGLLYNERTHQLIDGHMRKRLPREVMVDGKVPVMIGSWTDEQVHAIQLFLHPIIGMAIEDSDIIGRLMQVATEAGIVTPEMLADVGLKMLMSAAHDVAAGAGWAPEADTTLGTCVETVGYDLTSVWPRDGDHDTKVWPYWVKLPVKERDNTGLTPRYSRSPALEMERIVQTYMRPGDYFLEVCAGWWSFSTAAAVWGYHGVGIDIWPTSIKFGKRQLRAIKDCDGSFRVDQGNALTLPYDADTYDFIYCNPPFFALGTGNARERYGDAREDIGSIMDLETWLTTSGDMMAEILRVAKPGALIVMVMNDHRIDGELVLFHSLWIDEARRRGLILHDLVIQTMRTQQVRMWRRAFGKRYTCKAHEYVMVFKKPGGADTGPDVPEMPVGDEGDAEG